jgi:glycosyltransferase involved in cell wall biosynthesis
MDNKLGPKVSIIIPVYNGSNFVKKAIDSALAQTYKNIEIIVVNDGSTDEKRTEEICLSYGKRIRYFHKENGGVATALNFGIEKMNGEYFSWLSHDDVYKPDKIKKQIEFLEKNKEKNIILFSNYELMDQEGKFLSKVTLDHKTLIEKPEYALLRGAINGITLLIPKKAFDEHGGFNKDLKCTQDYDMWKRIMSNYKFIHSEDIQTKTRIHPEQDSNKHPDMISEGDKLWIGMMSDLPIKTKERLEGGEQNFYKEMVTFLKNTPYKGGMDFANNKVDSLHDGMKMKIGETKVSVIIPFYNRIPLLFKSLESVISQTHKNIEILLINDASTDDLTELNSYLKRDNRIILINLSKNSGAAAARNVGMKKATGEYIAFLDSDDLFQKDKIEEQLIAISLSTYNVSHTSYLRRDRISDMYMNSGNLSGNAIPEIIKMCLIATPTVMIRSEYLQENNFSFKEHLRIGEDVCFWLEILRSSKLLGLDKAYTIVNVNHESSSNDEKKQLQGLTNILSFILSDPEFSKYHHEISNLCNGFVDLSNRIQKEEDRTNGVSSYNFFQSKPKNPVLKFIYLCKYQGFTLTIKKILRKYGGRLLKI